MNEAWSRWDLIAEKCRAEPDNTALDAEYDAAYRACQGPIRTIKSTKARTLDCLRVKAQAISWCCAGDEIDFTDGGRSVSTDLQLVNSIIRTAGGRMMKKMTRRSLLSAIPSAGLAPFVPAMAEPADPLVRLIEKCRDQIAVFNSIREDELTKDNEPEYVAATYETPMRQLIDETPATTSLAGVREAIRLAHSPERTAPEHVHRQKGVVMLARETKTGRPSQQEDFLACPKGCQQNQAQAYSLTTQPQPRLGWVRKALTRAGRVRLPPAS